MKFYSNLSRIGFLKKYSYKFLFIAFLGIHIPLIGIIAFIVTSQHEILKPGTIVLIALVLTLIATGITLYFLNRLLSPLEKSKMALVNYMENGDLPELPVHYQDEAGILMSNLQQTLLNLNEMIQSKDLLVGVLSHDVRKPLGHMISYASLVKESNDSEKISQYSDKIIESGNRQLDMMTDILHILQLQGTQLEADNKKAVNALKICETIAQNHEELLHKKSIEVHIGIPDDQQINVHENLFSHVIDNLLHNAIKFSPTKSNIYIEGRHLSNGESVITIRDEGVGFNPSDNEAIFQRFTDKGKKGTAGESSTGLGLFVSHKIVERHGGVILAESKGVGQGASFTIRIPES